MTVLTVLGVMLIGVPALIWLLWIGTKVIARAEIRRRARRGLT
jgi:hypothetical protein